jgi:hypothetical protein
MNLSDGMYRSIPCFSSPELTEAIVKGYHGDGFIPVIPVLKDYVLDYKVTFNDLWSELNLTPSSVGLDEYKGISFELDRSIPADQLHVKIYGDGEDKYQYGKFSGSSATVTFDPEKIGNRADRITLQLLQNGGLTITVKSVHLIRQDGTLEASTPSVFWGCEMEMIANQQ